jgi:hypothetical protein
MENSKTQTNPDKNSQVDIPKPKCTTFTYIGKKTTCITKISKHTNINIAYRNHNTIQENFTPKPIITKTLQLPYYRN